MSVEWSDNMLVFLLLKDALDIGFPYLALMYNNDSLVSRLNEG
jgi:hypothetical protein